MAGATRFPSGSLSRSARGGRPRLAVPVVLGVLLGTWLAVSPAAAATLDWSTVVWSDGQLTNTYTVGGVDVRITVSTAATGTFTAFGVSSPYEDGPPPGPSAFNFGCCLDLGVIFNPTSNQGTSTIDIDVEFLEVGTSTPASVSGVSFEISDIDFSPPPIGENSRTDQVVITSDGGNPTLTAKTLPASFSIAGNTATSDGVTEVFASSENGTVLVDFGGTALTTVNVDYNEVSGNVNPGGRGIGLFFDLEFSTEAPAIDIEKATDGQDADTPTGPVLTVGTSVSWTYEVTNTGNVTLTNVAVTDDQGVAVTCPETSLDPGESMTCTASGTVELGQYSNVGTATGESPSAVEVNATDPSHYLGVENPAIDVEKATEGQDADAPPGPALAIGSTVTWTYVVTNTGDVPLTGVAVSDSDLGAVTCPQDTLAVGESMTCTANGTVQAGQYDNLATASGQSPGNQTVQDTDPSHYFGVDAAIDVEKATNGQDADAPPGPTIPVGDPVTWTYVVTNTGNVALSTVAVTDDELGAVSCPKTTLAVGESMTCTADGTAQAGQYSNLATASGQTPGAVVVQDTDPSHYFGAAPDIGIEKLTNGQDADTPPGPALTVGDPVTWTYVVTNTGNVALSNVTVTDDQGVVVSCPKTTLAPGETMLCSAAGTVEPGQYANVGTATGEPPEGGTVQDDDPSHYFGQEGPRIDVEKTTNGQDADTAPGPTIPVGDPVTWTYVVTNTGNVALSNVAVTDDELGAVSCPKTTLAPGESMTCIADGTAQAGQYSNLATAAGESAQGTVVQDTDPSHYLGQSDDEPAIDVEKATDGQDADSAPGPTLAAGDPVTWTYVVTNVGNVTLSNVAVTDDQGVVVTCPKTTLAPGESMTCTANGTVQVGQYANVGTAVGEPPEGDPVQDSDPSHYVGTGPAVDLVKTAGDAEDDQPLQIPLPATVTYSYKITNTGATWLSDLEIVDDLGTFEPADDVTLTAAECPGLAGPLPPGGMLTCTADILVTEQTVNLATVTGNPTDDDGTDLPGLAEVTDDDEAVVVGQEVESPLDIPTLGEWALLVLVLLLTLVGLAVLQGARWLAG